MACFWPAKTHRPAVFLDRDHTLNRQLIRDGSPYRMSAAAHREQLDSENRFKD